MIQLTIDDYLASRPQFAGSDYNAEFDQERLTGQIRRVFDAVKDQRFRTLGEIAAITGDPEASVSAQLRHLRKPKFGGWLVQKRLRGDPKRGLWEYRLAGQTSH
jgi:hypothetical protein